MLAPNDAAILRTALQAIQGEIQRQLAKNEERRILSERLEEIREKCKSFHGFTKEAWHVLEPSTPFKDNWHLGAVAEHLEAINRKQIRRLMVNEPPGMMKSLQCSVLFNAWEWGPAMMPGMRYLTTSYREDYALRDSRKSRDLIQSEWYQTLYPSIKLTRDGEKDFENNFRGVRKAVPFKSLTAGRGNRLIIDDPHSVDQAESILEREGAVRTFRESATSRLNDPETDAIIVIMHRLHPADICGTIEELGLEYTRLILPMEYARSITVKTPWFEDPRTDEGQLLFPERLGKEKLDATKVELGPHAYDTQYLQRPRAREGSYFFNTEQLLEPRIDDAGITTYHPSPQPTRCDAVFAVVDSATKVGKGRDGTGVKYFAYVRFPIRKLFILDWDLQQMEAAVLEHWLPNVATRGEELAKECGARGGYTGCWIEDKDSGQILIQQATKRKMKVHAIIEELTAMGKDGRAVNISGYVYKGLVRYTEHAFNKTWVYKGRSKNHSLEQVTTYRMGHGTPLDEDELFDCFNYGVAITLGDVKGN